MSQKPISITAERSNRELTVKWDDGHISLYSFELLRLGCPCAECRGGHEKMGGKPDPSILHENVEDGPAIHLKTVDGVGAYGIKPVWEDGHDFGIYTWEYLRRLCTCPACADNWPQESTETKNSTN